MKTVFITGACSGIGEAAAILFKDKGWNVATTTRNGELIKTENYKQYYMDVRNIQSVDNCLTEVFKDFPEIDVVINNAGVYHTSPLSDTPVDKIKDIIETNIEGSINVMHKVIPHLIDNRGGTIINISSVAGRITFPYQTVYHTSKWAIEGLSESLFYELKPHNIKVKIVEPGMVKTNLYKNIFSDSFENIDKKYKLSFSRWIKFLNTNYQKGYSPSLDAATIYKAANDRNNKLKYTTDFNTRLLLFLRSLLPLSCYQKLIYKMTGI